jgi:hypothetical protein
MVYLLGLHHRRKMQIKIGDKIVETDKLGVIKATSKEIKHPDGRIDVQVFVPCLRIHSKAEEIKKENSDGIGSL